MKVLLDLLPASFTAKAEPVAKDSRQKQQPRQQGQSTEQVEAKTTAEELVEAERRNGEERRQQRMKRGRWLESRDRNDRRATALTVFVKV